jgi:hypothetical protein
MDDQSATNLAYWNVVTYFVEIDDGGDIIETEVPNDESIWTAHCSGVTLVDIGPISKDTYVEVTIEGNLIIFEYGWLLTDDTNENEIQENEIKKSDGDNASSEGEDIPTQIYKCKLIHTPPTIVGLSPSRP